MLFRSISLDYLTALYREYESFIADISRSVPVIRVDWDHFRTTEEMVEVINQAYLHGSFLKEVSWTPSKV